MTTTIMNLISSVAAGIQKLGVQTDPASKFFGGLFGCLTSFSNGSAASKLLQKLRLDHIMDEACDNLSSHTCPATGCS